MPVQCSITLENFVTVGFSNSAQVLTYRPRAVFSPIFRATGKSVFQTGKAARLKILFLPEVEMPS